MAWDLTKPSMTDPTLSAAFGNIRENFRALAQDNWTKTAGYVNVATGSLGIGVAPSVPLDIAKTNATANLRITDSTFGARVKLVSNTVNVDLFNTGGAGQVGTSSAHSFQIITGAVGRMTFDNAGNVGIAQAPSVRLHIGAGGTGTNAEELRIDSGSGAGGHGILSFHRNAVFRAQMGVAGTVGAFIAGAAINDFCIATFQGMVLSGDSGATLHASLSAGGHWRAKNIIATAAAVASAAGEVAIGGTTATTVGAAGGAAALPATPLGYIICSVAGTQVKVPYYNN